MKYARSATASFDASHKIPDHPECYRLHGHTYSVRVTVAHDDLDAGYPRGSEDLDRLLGVTASELHLRDLSEMVPGLRTTTPGLAAWFFERLAARFPGLTTVEVWHEHEQGSISR